MYVLKGTELGRLYEKYSEGCGDGTGEDMLIPWGEKKLRWHIFSMEEYLELITDILEILPESMVIHRITGDAPKSLLLAPLWSGDKKRVLNAFTKRLKDKESYQGKRRS